MKPEEDMVPEMTMYSVSPRHQRPMTADEKVLQTVKNAGTEWNGMSITSEIISLQVLLSGFQPYGSCLGEYWGIDSHTRETN